jgi:hypothetical protein
MVKTVPLFLCSFFWCQLGAFEIVLHDDFLPSAEQVIAATDNAASESLAKSPAKKKKRSKKKKSVVPKTVADREREAVFCDIPLPVGGVLQVDAPDVADGLCKGQTLTYLVEESREEITEFYERGMMQLGWHNIAHSRGSEDALVYETPTKIALVVLRPFKPKKGWSSPKILVTLHEVSKKQEAELD